MSQKMTFETLKHSLWFSFKNVEHFFKLINITDWLIWIWSMLHTNWKSNNSLKFDILAWLKIVIVISKRKNIIALTFYFNSLDKVLNLHKNNKEYRYFDNNDNLLNASCLAWWHLCQNFVKRPGAEHFSGPFFSGTLKQGNFLSCIFN